MSLRTAPVLRPFPAPDRVARIDGPEAVARQPERCGEVVLLDPDTEDGRELAAVLRGLGLTVVFGVAHAVRDRGDPEAPAMIVLHARSLADRTVSARLARIRRALAGVPVCLVTGAAVPGRALPDTHGDDADAVMRAAGVPFVTLFPGRMA